MEMKIKRYGLQIYPRTGFGKDESDLAFIEEVLGLEKDGDWVKLVRRNCYGLDCLAYLTTERDESK